MLINEFGPTNMYLKQAAEAVANRLNVIEIEATKDNTLRGLFETKERSQEETSRLDSRASSLEILNLVDQFKTGFQNGNLSDAFRAFRTFDDYAKPEPETFAAIMALNSMKLREGIAPTLNILGKAKDGKNLVAVDRQNQTVGCLNVLGIYTPVAKLPAA